MLQEVKTTETKILVLDIETTGFLNKGGKIVEIGIVELNLENGEIKTLFDNICHERPITKKEVEESWIVNNSTLTVEEIQHSKQLKIYFKEIQDIINSYPLGCTAYNNSFDFGFLEDRGFTFPKKLPCPMMLSINEVKAPMKKGHFRGNSSKYKYPNFQETWDHFFGKTGYIESHRGVDDAIHEAKVIYELYKRNIFKIK